MDLLVLGLVVAFLVFMVYRAVAAFKSSCACTFWERLYDSTWGSATILWNYIVAFVGMLLGWSEFASEALGLPEVTSFIQNYMPSKYVAGAFVIISVVSIVARLRRLTI